MKQPIVEYLFDYILKNVCHGNKSEFARKMDIRRQDVNRLDQRIHEGATSARAMESMLNLLMKESLSIDEVMKDYNDDPEKTIVKIDSPTQILHEKLMREWKQANQRMEVFKGAESFMYELEATFCSSECRATHQCENDCPCKRFYEYIAWLKGEMDKSA